MDAAPMVLSLADVQPAAAEIFVALAACVLLLVDAVAGPRARNAVFVLAIASLAGAAWVSSTVGPEARLVLLGGHFLADPMGTVLKLFAYGAAAVTLLYSRDYLERRCSASRSSCRREASCPCISASRSCRSPCTR